MTPEQEVHTTVSRLFPTLKENKKRETARLVHEICKRDRVTPAFLLTPLEGAKFPELKAALLKKRYPSLYGKVPPDSYYLPNLDFTGPAPGYNPGLMPREFYPKHIYVEKAAAGTALAQKTRALFPHAAFTQIETTAEFIKAGGLAKADYSTRHERLFLFNERFDFIKPCPCTKNCVCCGYNVLNLGFGCVFDCEYCFLQEYQNFPAISFPCNAEDFLCRIPAAKLNRGLFETARIGSGECTDSLVFDHITDWAETITEQFRNSAGVTFEFKTKSVNCGAFYKMKPVRSVVISWSLNPPETECEHFAAPVEQRLKTAAELTRLGWRVGFHFDPMLLYPGWRAGYQKIIQHMLAQVKPESIAWISAGTLRFRPPLKKVIERRFPRNIILDSELVQGFDGKLRYGTHARAEAYRALKAAINAGGGEKIPFYLCMEEAAMWKQCGINTALPE